MSSRKVMMSSLKVVMSSHKVMVSSLDVLMSFSSIFSPNLPNVSVLLTLPLLD